MKKIFISVLFILFLIPPACASAEEFINIYFDSELGLFEPPPITENDRILVPVRQMFEKLDMDVSYNDTTHTAYAVKYTYGGNGVKTEALHIALQDSSDIMLVEDKQVYLDVPAKIIGDYMYIPLRAVSEACSMYVQYREYPGYSCNVYINNKTEDVDNTHYLELPIARRNYIWGHKPFIDDPSYGYVHYRIENNNAIITGMDYNAEGHIVIPEYLDGYPVTMVENFGFAPCKTVADGVSAIAKVDSISLPDTVAWIGKYAFYCVSTKSIKLPNELFYLGSCAFLGSPIETIELPETINEINYATFADCKNLKHIEIPSSIRSIGFAAFADCEALEQIALPEGLEVLDAAFPQSGLTELRIPSNVKKLPKYHLLKGSKNLKTYVNNSPHTEYLGGLMDCPALETVIVGNGTKEVCEQALRNCTALKKISLPSRTEQISFAAFANCSSLEEIIIPDNAETIAAEAFYGCSGLKNVRLGNKLKTLKRGCFSKCCNLSSLTISGSVSEIDKESFTDTAIANIELSANNPNFVIQDGLLFNKDKSVLLWCMSNKEGAVTVPPTVKEVRSNAFNGCEKVTSIDFPPELSLYPLDFERCYSLKSVTGGDGTYAFVYDNALYSYNAEYEPGSDGKYSLYICYIPNDTEDRLVLANEFNNCPAKISTSALSPLSKNNMIKTLVMPEYPYTSLDMFENLERIDINGSYKDFSIDGIVYSKYEKDGKQTIYITRCPKNYKGSVQIAEGTDYIAEDAFCGCSKITDIYLPSTLADDSESLFEDCDMLNRFIISPNNQNLEIRDGNVYNKHNNKCVFSLPIL